MMALAEALLTLKKTILYECHHQLIRLLKNINIIAITTSEEYCVCSLQGSWRCWPSQILHYLSVRPLGTQHQRVSPIYINGQWHSLVVRKVRQFVVVILMDLSASALTLQDKVWGTLVANGVFENWGVGAFNEPLFAKSVLTIEKAFLPESKLYVTNELGFLRVPQFFSSFLTFKVAKFTDLLFDNSIDMLTRVGGYWKNVRYVLQNLVDKSRQLLILAIFLNRSRNITDFELLFF